MNPPPPPAFRILVDHPEALADAIHGATLRPLRLRGSPAASELSRLHLPNLCLDVSRLGPAMFFAGAMPERAYTLIFVLDCPGQGRSFTFSTDHNDGYLGLFPPGGEIEAATPANYANAILTVPEAVFLSSAESWCPELPDSLLAKGGAMRIPPAAQGPLRALVSDFSDLLRREPQALAERLALAHLEQELLEAFLRAVRGGLRQILPAPGARVASREARFREAREWMKAHLHLPISMVDVAEASGMSIRALEQVFFDYLGLGPAAYLRQCRLHAARRSLLGLEGPKPATVKEAALSNGFWHLGRFASYYRDSFWESPRQTLATITFPPGA